MNNTLLLTISDRRAEARRVYSNIWFHPVFVIPTQEGPSDNTPETAIDEGPSCVGMTKHNNKGLLSVSSNRFSVPPLGGPRCLINCVYVPVLLLLLLSHFAVAQLMHDSLLIEGHYRVFHFNQPVTSLNKPSLVFVLHGSGGDGEGMMQATGKMEQQAKESNTLVVYPDGYKRYWNECRKSSPAQANQEDVNEQAFFQGMIQYFHQRYAVNTDHVFVVGTSGGGHMVYKLALTMPLTFRAVTAIIANLPDSTNMDCVPTGKPVAIMIVNGTQDPINPYLGGRVVLGKNMDMGVVLSTDRTLGYWAGLAHYQGKPTMEALPDADPQDGKTIERYTYQAAGKPDIVLLKVIGGKHDYPNDLDVHVEALRFFMSQIHS